MARKNQHIFVSEDGEPRHSSIDAALNFLAAHYEHRPSLDEVARVAGMSSYHFQRTFRAWTGVTPKQFMQYLQLSRAKDLLIAENSLMSTALELGLSGTSRLHDLFVSCEAVSPGEFKSRGAGLTIWYGIHESPFGRALVGATDRGICWLGFPGSRADAFAVRELKSDWAGARIMHDPARTGPLAKRAFARGLAGCTSKALRLHIRGTNFQLKVWEALLTIPFGRLATYQDVASAIGQPSASRAVGQAVEANPISLIIPCHRVILKSGIIHNYRWGVGQKRTILAIEQAQRSARNAEP
jgi:AraC family transcriptional regulator of adaptative response/methylated-DNA-[protein]-cysteine methyltransferase